jgi:hypothetical protein
VSVLTLSLAACTFIVLHIAFALTWTRPRRAPRAPVRPIHRSRPSPGRRDEVADEVQALTSHIEAIGDAERDDEIRLFALVVRHATLTLLDGYGRPDLRARTLRDVADIAAEGVVDKWWQTPVEKATERVQRDLEWREYFAMHGSRRPRPRPN